MRYSETSRTKIKRTGSVLIAALVCLSLLMVFMVLQSRTIFLTTRMLKHHEEHVQAEIIAQNVYGYLSKHPEDVKENKSWQIKDQAAENIRGTVRLMEKPGSTEKSKNYSIHVSWNEQSKRPVSTSLEFISPAE